MVFDLETKDQAYLLCCLYFLYKLLIWVTDLFWNKWYIKVPYYYWVSIKKFASPCSFCLISVFSVLFYALVFMTVLSFLWNVVFNTAKGPFLKSHLMGFWPYAFSCWHCSPCCLTIPFWLVYLCPHSFMLAFLNQWILNGSPWY